MDSHRSALRALGLAATTAAAVLASAAATSTRTYELISEADAGDVPGDDRSFDAAVSPSGRFVAFTSLAGDIVPDTGNTWSDILLRDRKAGTTTRVSANADGGDGNLPSYVPCLSNNGRFVLFYSLATDLVDGDENGRNDVFLRDMKTGEIAAVSVDSDGAVADDDSQVYGASLSGNGRYAVFYSDATNLTDAGSNGDEQVYLHDRVKGTTRLVSAGPEGVPGNGSSANPSISANGRFIAYNSRCTNLVDGPAVGDTDNIFVYDAKKRTTAMVMTGLEGEDTYADCYDPVVTNNGRVVAFYSDASNLVTGDTNEAADTFVVDRKAGTTTRISVGPEGAQANGDSWDVAMSANGKVVVFYSDADNLVAGDGNETSDVFRWDPKTGAVVRLSVDAAGTEGNGYSWVYAPSLSSNGRWLGLSSGATNLAAGVTDENDEDDVFLTPAK